MKATLIIPIHLIEILSYRTKISTEFFSKGRMNVWRENQMETRIHSSADFIFKARIQVLTKIDDLATKINYLSSYRDSNFGPSTVRDMS
jgi:hypothetical protein